MFVGFGARQSVLAAMLRSMAGIDGPRDALTRYTRALTGSYYFVPSVDDLRAITPAEA
jgi:putative iron-dependent peroxidase